MKKLLIFVFLMVFCHVSSNAQEYKIKKFSGKIVLNLSRAVVVGYAGEDVIFSLSDSTVKAVPKEAGLEAINSSGYMDNTGLGISVNEDGKTLMVNEVLPDLPIKILVPDEVKVVFICHKVVNSAPVVFKNFVNAITVETDYNNVVLKNIKGPVKVNALYGSVNAIFDKGVKGPIALTSSHSTVDVTIPGSLNANIKLKSSQNVIMISPALKIKVEKDSTDSVASYGSLLMGKLNDGGLNLTVNSTYGKIYFRKAD